VHGGAFDLSEADGRHRLVEFAAAELGGLDILVNNVGTNIRKKTPEYTAEEVVF
jgi:Tropinone reductase 1